MRKITYDGMRLKETEEITNLAISNGATVDTIEGALLDDIFIDQRGLQNRVRIGKARARDYILMQAVYINEWSSDYTVTFTDDIKAYESTLQAYKDNSTKGDE